MSKFDSGLAEAAYLVANNGFAEREEGSVDGEGWNALCVLSPTVLLNLGAEADLIESVQREYNDMRFNDVSVWIHENEAGFVDVLFRDTVGTEIRDVWGLRFPNE